MDLPPHPGTERDPNDIQQFIRPFAYSSTQSALSDCLQFSQFFTDDLGSSNNAWTSSGANGASSYTESNQIGASTNNSQYLTRDSPKLFCLVCGDNSTGKHYGAYSCEGCKAFFKRSVRKKASYICRGNQNCVIHKGSRQRCPSCRFRECIANGMKPESVQEPRQSNRVQPPVEYFEVERQEPRQINRAQPPVEYFEVERQEPRQINRVQTTVEYFEVEREELRQINKVQPSVEYFEVEREEPRQINRVQTPVEYFEVEREEPRQINRVQTPVEYFEVERQKPRQSNTVQPSVEYFEVERQKPRQSNTVQPSVEYFEVERQEPRQSNTVQPSVEYFEVERQVQNQDPFMMDAGTLEPAEIQLASYTELFQLIEWANKFHQFNVFPLRERVALLRGGWNELLLIGIAFRSMNAEGSLKLADGLTVDKFSANQVGLAEIFDHILSRAVSMMKDLKLDEAEFVCLKSMILFNPAARALPLESIRPVTNVRSTMHKLLGNHLRDKYHNYHNRYTELSMILSNLSWLNLRSQEHLFFNLVISDTRIDDYLTTKLAAASPSGS